MQFTNSLWAPGLPIVCLFGMDAAYPYEPSELLKALANERGQCKSKIFVAAAMSELGVKSAALLEREIMKMTPDRTYPVDRPHLFDRMRRGQPQIDKVMANPEHISRPWVDLLLRIASQPSETLSMPIWRLLDPSPLTWLEYQECLGRVMVSVLRVLRMKSTVPELNVEAWPMLSPAELHRELMNITARGQPIVTIDVAEDSGPSIKLNVLPKPEAPNLHSLTCLMISLRYWELVGDLESYFLTLRVAIELLERLAVDADLLAFVELGARHLRAAFGRVAVRSSMASESLFQRLERASLTHEARRLAAGRPERAQLRLDFRRVVTFDF